MDNREVSAVFSEMADLLEIAGRDEYRVRAFRRIARVVDGLSEPLADLVKYQRLEKIPGIGEGAVARIKDILRTGTCRDLQRLRESLPSGLREMVKIDGIGTSTARRLYQEMRVGSVPELEAAVSTGQLARAGFLSERLLEKIQHGLELYKKGWGLKKVPLVEALATGERFVEAVRAEPATEKAELCGSARRRKDMVDDLDILVGSHDPKPVVARFITLPGVVEVLSHGEGRARVRLETGQQMDLRIVVPETFGAALHYFTGSQQHNIYLRARGNRRGLKISDKGIFRRSDELRLAPGESEADVFTAVGLPYIAPELRENTGELEAAARGDLPRLVEETQIRGDLHIHTSASGDSDASLHAMAAAARATGLEYMAVADHASNLTLDALRAQRQEMGPVGDRVGLRILAGVEVDILPDGSLAYDPAALSELDWVVASVHSHLDMPRAEMTARLVRAMESGIVDCIGHPTGRLLGERPGSELDVDRVLRAARRTGVALEVNGDPRRMDLDAAACRRARELHVPLALGSDAHAPTELAQRRFAVYTARRGWLEASDLLNTHGADMLSEWQTARRSRVKGGRKEPAPRTLPSATEKLAEALQASPLDADTKARLERYFRDGGDADLEAALRRLSDNPVQKAFELLYSATS